jgi:hypothetical protein
MNYRLMGKFYGLFYRITGVPGCTIGRYWFPNGFYAWYEIRHDCEK